MTTVREFRVAVTVADFDAALKLYRDTFGMPLVESWDTQEGRGAVLELPRATLELLDVEHSHWVDESEVGRRLGQHVRFALEVEDVVAAGREVSEAGPEPVAPVAHTPWGHLNLRMKTTDGMQLTLFQT